MKIYLNTLQHEKWMDLYFKIDFSKCDSRDIFSLPLSSLYIKDFARDPYSKALINIDNNGYDNFIRLREQNKKLIELENKVNNMGADLNEIKRLLTNLVDKK